MTKKQKEEIILYHQRKRKKRKIKLAVVSSILILIALVLLGMYYFFNKGHTIKYKENTDVNYGVNLIENEFYEKNYLEEGIDVISSLIKSIKIDFNYALELEEEVEYKYSYKILAEIGVKEKSKTNLIYETKETLLNKTEKSNTSKQLEIQEKIKIDYSKYNNQIEQLLEEYKLQNTTSELSISLYLNVTNKATGNQINKESKVMSVVIPLTTKTVEITINENVKNYQGEILLKENQIANSEYILITGIFVLIIGGIVLVVLIKYILDTRSAEKMYEDELKKILFDYKSYIQKINNEINYKDYKIIQIDTFNELLGMREEVQAPILMYTEEKNRKTTFMIINANLLFEYILSADLIREKLIKRSKEKEEKRGGENNEKNK